MPALSLQQSLILGDSVQDYPARYLQRASSKNLDCLLYGTKGVLDEPGFAILPTLCTYGFFYSINNPLLFRRIVLDIVNVF